MVVPLLDLKAQYEIIKDDVEKALVDVARSQMLILGPEVQKLEETLANYCNVNHAIAVSSGSDALIIALMALGIGEGDEVICPTYSFFATAGAIVRVGAKPVFADSSPIDFNIDVKSIENLITKNTKAIIPVHLYGQAAGMDAIMKIAEEKGIYVIEDGAQAIGAQYKNGSPVGSIGHIGCFSFYPTKNLGAFGEGGLVTTNNDKLAQKLRILRNHGMEPRYYHSYIGGNFRLDAIQAAVLSVKFPHLESWHEARRKNASYYNSLFIENGLAEKSGITKFDDNNKVLLPAAIYESAGVKNYHIFNQYVIHVKKRDDLRKYLADNSIGSEIYYPAPFHRQECFKYLNPVDADYPVANFLAEHTLALPVYPELKPEQIEFVVDTIKNYYS
jgi:dTDP-4-amino-4,6-dideoxygalactose transaminase